MAVSFLYSIKGNISTTIIIIIINIIIIIYKDGILRYYDAESNAYSADNKPRGRLDLKVVNYCFIKNEHIDGAPTQYIMQIAPANNEERWRLCAETKEQYEQWCEVLESYLHKKETLNDAQGVLYASDDEDGSVNVKKEKTKENNRSSMIIDTERKSVVARRSSIKGKKGGLKVASKGSFINPETIESFSALVIMNLSFYMATKSSTIVSIIYIIISNYVISKTISLRAERLKTANTVKESATAEETDEAAEKSEKKIIPSSSSGSLDQDLVTTTQDGTPIAGATLTQVFTEPHYSPDHTWCKCDHRQFKVRIGPDYNKYKKKAPSGAPLFEPFAIDVFCTKQRCDHATQRFALPEELVNVDTFNEHVPPIFVVQIQIPSEPPPSMFTTVEDGPGWSILLYFKITEDTRNQLKNLSTASPAVKLFADYCKKAPNDPTFRGRFKVINSCTNLEELGMPSAIVQWNAKPVLIRRTGTLFKGKGYIEKDIHVHKFATFAKSSIHMITSRCGLMYMQIGFVIEGRDDGELPEVLFGCVAVNRPQESEAEFLFSED